MLKYNFQMSIFTCLCVVLTFPLSCNRLPTSQYCNFLIKLFCIKHMHVLVQALGINRERYDCCIGYHKRMWYCICSYAMQCIKYLHYESNCSGQWRISGEGGGGGSLPLSKQGGSHARAVAMRPFVPHRSIHLPLLKIHDPPLAVVAPLLTSLLPFLSAFGTFSIDVRTRTRWSSLQYRQWIRPTNSIRPYFRCSLLKWVINSLIHATVKPLIGLQRTVFKFKNIEKFIFT